MENNEFKKKLYSKLEKVKDKVTKPLSLIVPKTLLRHIKFKMEIEIKIIN